VRDPATPSTSARLRVLLVDDDVFVLRGFFRNLAEDYAVVTATSAREALYMVGRGKRFDAIISDVNMPDMTGLDFHRELVELAPESAARLIFVTAGVAASVREALDGLPNPCLDKPVRYEDLVAAIRSVTEAG
jgi:CheY-like chemotaxis protein